MGRRPAVHRSSYRSRARRPKQGLALILLAAAVLILARWQGQTPPEPAGPLEPGLHRVARVVDGDTLLLTDKTRVRLIGANTPETVKPNSPIEPWGPEAAEFTRQFVTDRDVRLEFDGPRTDRYGRTLAHVWVGDRMLNEELIRAGLARFEPQYPYSAEKKERFLQAELEAERARVGIWSGGR